MEKFENSKGMCIFYRTYHEGKFPYTSGAINFVLQETALSDGLSCEDVIQDNEDCDIHIGGYLEGSTWIASSFNSNLLEPVAKFVVELCNKIDDGRSNKYKVGLNNMELFWDCMVECLSESNSLKNFFGTKLTDKAYHSLRRAHITNVEEISRHTRKELLNIRGIGIVSVREIEQKLKEIGLSLHAEG